MGHVPRRLRQTEERVEYREPRSWTRALVSFGLGIGTYLLVLHTVENIALAAALGLIVLLCLSALLGAFAPFRTD